MCPEEPMNSEEPTLATQETPSPQQSCDQNLTHPTGAQAPQVWTSSHAQQISAAEYREQSMSYTQQALRELKASPEYKKHTQKCQACGSSWYDGQWIQGCGECGGYAMTQPCPICLGRCGGMWTRNVGMSHRMHEAHWDGQCGMSEEQQAVFMVRRFLQTQDELADALQDLDTS